MILNNIDDIFDQFENLKGLLSYFRKFDLKGSTPEEKEVLELMNKLG